jgi:cell volume regulation protein A
MDWILPGGARSAYAVKTYSFASRPRLAAREDEEPGPLSIGLAMLAVGGVLAASVAVALGAAKSGLPALAAFLGLGMVLGSDGPGGIAFNDAKLAREVGVVALAAILYEGGLSTSWRRLREVAVPALLLSTIGVVVTAAITGAAAYGLFDLSMTRALLLGAVVASTDAAAVFATLRGTRLRRRLARTLEAESGANDPVAIALTLGLIAWIDQPSYDLRDLSVLLVRQLGLGLVIGIALGLAAMWVFARIPSSIEAFVPVASVATAAVAYGAADAAHGSGFLAVYLVGLAVGSTPSRYRGQLVAFHVGLAYVAQVALFIVLGLLVFPSQLPDVALSGLALAAVLVFLARPVAVWVSTVRLSHFNRRERLLLGWAGLRGAVPIVLATFVLSSHVSGANTIFNAVFFVVLVSVVLQGTTLEWVAKKLGLLVAFTSTEAPLEVSRHWQSLNLVEFVVSANHAIAGSAVRELGLPRDTLVAVLVRGDEAIPPRGSTTVRPGDVLFVLTPNGKGPELEDVFSRWRQRV